MAVDITKLKSIRDTYVYSQLNKDGAFEKNIKSLLEKGFVPTEKMLENQISIINSYYKYPLKTLVMDAYKSGTVKPMMFPVGISVTLKLPTCLPFILVAGSVNPNAVAVIDNYAIMEKNSEVITIDKLKLYMLLEGAYIARGIQITFNTLRQNTTMYVDAANIYAHMFTRVLNKKYALNVNKIAYQKVMYIAAKFFLLNLLQMNETETVSRYAAKVAPDIPDTTLMRLDDELKTTQSFESIEKLIQGIARCSYLIISGLNTLTMREYIRDFIGMYSNTALFALEHIAYFLFNIFSTVNGAFLNNQYSFNDVIGHTGAKIYGYVSNVVKNT